MRNEELGMRSFAKQCFGIAFIEKSASQNNANRNHSPFAIHNSPVSEGGI
jgi:hypothetical protein